MLTCGLKLTHDGSVAVIEDGRLVFSHEMEKIENGERHARITHFEQVLRALNTEGYALADFDQVAIDGWDRRVRCTLRDGFEELLDVAPYRVGMVTSEVDAPYYFQKYDLSYVSYTHYATHVASAYLTSPFAASGQAANVICWDGAMPPYLYSMGDNGHRIDGGRPLHFLIGDAYRELCQLFSPFDFESDWAGRFSLPGKIMAYVATGTPNEAFVQDLDRSYRDALEHVSGGRAIPDFAVNTALGRRVISGMLGYLKPVDDLNPSDGIASVQEWMGRLLVAGLSRALKDELEAVQLCFVGGCALNIKWNALVRALPFVAELWVPPFPNDAGSAIGAAALAAGGAEGGLRWNVYSGPALLPPPADHPGWSASPCSATELGALLHKTGSPVVALTGRAELGPRALGNRSILAPAGAASMKRLLNEAKGREWYRPVAPICLAERAAEIFDPGTPEPYMLFEHRFRPGWERRLPAVAHLDGTARLQTVSKANNPTLHEILVAYEGASGSPVLCNTSANLAGRGFFPDVRSAMEWGVVPTVWSDGVLWSRADGE